MADSPPAYRAVLDSNVLVAAQRSADPHGPNRELVERWKASEFTFLFSQDTLLEYAEKLLALSANREDAVEFIALISALGEAVEIEFFHLPRYPADADDIAFLLCASPESVGEPASHLPSRLVLGGNCRRPEVDFLRHCSDVQSAENHRRCREIATRG